MACKDCYIQIKINKIVPGYSVGQKIKVEARGGIPILKFWRDRLRDAKLDKCIEIVKPKVKLSTEKTEGEK